MFDFVIKIIGSGISSLIYFVSINFTINDSSLEVNTQLQDPITKEIVSLMKQEYDFKIEYYSSLIVNNSVVYKDTVINTLIYDSSWFCNGKEISYDSLQSTMGNVTLEFENYSPAENDEVSTFIKASIVEDSLFVESTGFKTKILWENYVPRINKSFLYSNGKFEEK